MCFLAVLLVITAASLVLANDNGFCDNRETFVTYQEVEETYMKQVEKERACPFFPFKKCKTKVLEPAVRNVSVPIHSYTSKRGCCDGYQKQGESCIPTCAEACENGFCSAPNTCSCNKGYKPLSLTRCISSCQNCNFGLCIAPEICECYSGFTKDENDLCKPKSICDPPCSINAICIKENTCKCMDGFIPDLANTTTCLPIDPSSTPHPLTDPPTLPPTPKPPQPEESQEDTYDSDEASSDSPEIEDEEETSPVPCDPGLRPDSDGICRSPCQAECLFGHCEDGKCICNEGFRMAPNNSFVCEPFCEHECSNGICIGDNRCLCEAGFELDPENRFVCIITNQCQCVNCDCIDADLADCWQGYTLTHSKPNDHRCEPICGDSDDEERSGCINGHCVGVSMCLCHEGFQISPENNYTCYSDEWCEFCRQSGEWCPRICEIVQNGDQVGMKNAVIREERKDVLDYWFVYLIILVVGVLVATIAITMLILSARKVEYNVGKKEESPNNVYFVRSDGEVEINI